MVDIQTEIKGTHSVVYIQSNECKYLIKTRGKKTCSFQYPFFLKRKKRKTNQQFNENGKLTVVIKWKTVNFQTFIWKELVRLLTK